jgi:signal-transduction protein with cAMP-binding, CBS, and nucleotidyltransferase domain
MKKKMKKLNDRIISLLRSKYQPVRFNSDFDLVYENQIPNTGIVLLEGEAALIHRKKELEKIEPGSHFGIHELVHDEPVKYGCQVKGNSEVILLPKSEVFSALNDQENPLHEIIQND